MAKSNTLQAIVEIAGTLSPTLEKSIGGVVDKLDGINVKALAVGAAAGGIAIATTKAVFKAGEALAKLGDDFNKTMNDLSATTGATGEELEALGDVVKTVYADNFGDSMADAGAAVADVSKMLDLTGDALAGATENAIALSDSFDYEVGESTRAASALMKNFGIDASDAYNIIAYGAQNGADQNGDLLDTLNEYSAQYSALGLSADQFVQGLVSASDEGVFSIDKVGDAVKEFNIRSKDLSDSSAEAYEALGMDANEMFEKFAAGGDTANEAFFEVVNALDNMDDPLEKNKAAVALFGTQYEDLGEDILPILASMQNSTLENVDALGQINEVKYNDLGSALEAIKRQAEVAFLPLATEISNSLISIMPVVSDLMTQLMPILGQLAQAIIPIVQDLVPQIAPLLTQLIPPIVSMAGVLASSVIPPIVEIVTSLIPAAISIVSALMPIIQVLIETVLPILVDIIQQIIPPVVQIVTALLPVIQQLLTALAPIVTQLFTALSPVLAAAGQLISTLLPPVISLIQTLMPIITTVASIISTVLTVAIQGLMPVIEGVISVVGTIASVFEAAFSGLVGIVKTPINAIIGLVNKAIGAINSISIDVPDWVPGLGGKHFGFSIPTIPMLATGGFTDGVSIAGEAGTEAVISFDQAYRSANIGYWMEAGKMLGVLGQNQNTTTSSLAGQLLTLDDFSLSELASENNTVVYDFSGMSYNPTVNTTGDGPDIMAQLREAGQEFFDWLETWIRRKEQTAYGY